VKIKSRAACGLAICHTQKGLCFADKYATVCLLITTPRGRNKKTALNVRAERARAHLAENASMCEQRRESWQILYSMRLCVYM